MFLGLPPLPALLVVLTTLVAARGPEAAPKQRSVLHIVFDDFRNDLPFYGQAEIHAPYLTALANRSLVFTRAYCNQAVCSPSRNSFLTGRRQNTTRVWNFLNNFRQPVCAVAPGVRRRFARPPLAEYRSAKPVETTGGWGACCEACTAHPGCRSWVYGPAPSGPADGSASPHTCALYADASPSGSAPANDTFVSGESGVEEAWTSLPQHFRESGYLTLGVGKLFHDGTGSPNCSFPRPGCGPGSPPYADSAHSWSNTSLQYPDFAQYPPFVNSFQPNHAYLCPAGQGVCPDQEPFCVEDVPRNGSGADPTMLDVPVYLDAVNKLRAAAANQRATGQPFFLGVGIKRPHLVWRVPQYFYDLYANTTIELPRRTTLDRSIDPIAWTSFFTLKNPYDPYPDERIVELRRHYYAAISFADYIAGQVLAEVAALGLQDDLAILVHADHGWHLGEYNMWEKRTLWEFATRVPMLLHVPWLKQSHGRRTAEVVELVDVFPTLCDLAGIPLPTGDTHALEGVSFAPLAEDPGRQDWGRGWALSVYPRCPHGEKIWDDHCIHTVERTAFGFMGYSIRTPTHRYTEFVAWNGTAMLPDWARVHSRELYSHADDDPAGWDRADDYEDVNLVASADPALLASLAAQLRRAAGCTTCGRLGDGEVAEGL